MEHKTIHYNAVEFGRRIRTIRKQKKMTQQELAELLFLSEESVSNFETGKTMCMPEHVIQMCQIFDVSADYFYFGKNYKLQGNDIFDVCTRVWGIGIPIKRLTRRYAVAIKWRYGNT